MKSVRVVVSGRVQGVGFRWFVRDAADAQGVAGWVRNVRDGTVEAELHGEDAGVQAVLDAMVAGPVGSRVDRVDVTAAAAQSGAVFSIRST